MGTIDLAMASPGHLGKLIPEVQAFLLHYTLGDNAEINRRALRDPELRRFLGELYAEKGLRYLDAFGEGWMVWTTRTPVRRPEDFEGVKIRVMTSPLLLAAYEAYGASPTPLPYGEVYGALQLHMIDAQVNPIFAIEEMSFYEVTDYLVFPQQAQFVTTVAANPRFRDRLSPERRVLLDDTVAALHEEIFDVVRSYNQERLDAILERRPELRVLRLDADERAAFAERAVEVRDVYRRLAGPRADRMLETLERAVARARDGS
jgi:TRAP-type C4-dicarboxylate transport system substrate-binding protein